MQQVWELLTLVLIVSQEDMHGEAGTSSGIMLIRDGDTFVRATGPVRPLLGELEEFVVLH